jgi:two-component system, LytTR family, response regulator
MMDNIRSIIVDDEPGNVITLAELLKEYCPQVTIIGTAANIEEAYNLVVKTLPQLIFLDIEMPNGNGFDLLDKIGRDLPDFEVVFVTAFDNYAIKAFKYAALDYILKPVNIEELQKIVQKVNSRLNDKNTNIRITSLLSNLKSQNNTFQKIGLPTIEGFHFEDIDDIIHLEAEGNYTNVYLKNKKIELVSKTLKEFEDILPESVFCRVHHSSIININYIKKYYKGRGGYVEMTNGVRIEISSRKKDDFFERFKH